MLFTVVITIENASASNTYREVQASEVLSQIKDCIPVCYNDIIISGDLNLSGLGRVNNSIEIINSSIPECNFGGVAFEKDVVFRGTTFGKASFDKTNFQGFSDFSNTTWKSTSFSEAVFDQPAIFDGTEFLDSVSFENALFKKDTCFNWVHFLGTANFNYTQFDYYTYFSGARFLGKALFSDAKFGGALDFSAANFTREAKFIRSEFEGISFDDASFGGLAQFSLARFHRLSNLDSTVFADEANFNLARFEDSVSFSGANFKDNAFFGGIKFERLVNFRNANFEKKLVLKASQFYDVLLENATFCRGSIIVLEDADYSIFRVPWKTIGDHIQYDGTAYLALVKNYKDLNWFSDSNDCYYSYRKLSLEHESFSPMQILDYLAWVFYGFGVKPEIPLGWSISSILIFGAVFWFKKNLRKFIRKETINMVPLNERSLKAQIEVTLIEEPISFIDPFLFSLSNFTSGWTTFLYPFTDFKTTGGHSHLAIIERILGSVFISLILAAIIKTYLIR